MMMAVRRCCPSSLVLLLLLVSSSSSSSFQNVFGQRWSFSLLRHRELKRDETVVKCVDKDQAVDNAASDDDTVFCNSTEGVYDVSRLDPTTPPKRCVNWTSDMINLGALHPLAICIQWHTLYGIHSTNYQEEEQSTRAPTTVISPPSTRTLSCICVRARCTELTNRTKNCNRVRSRRSHHDGDNCAHTSAVSVSVTDECSDPKYHKGLIDNDTGK